MVLERKNIILTQDLPINKQPGSVVWENTIKSKINELKDEALTFDDLLGYVRDLSISYVSSNVLQISTGVCVSDSVDDYIVSNSTINVDISTSGVNGLDTGSVSTNWYYLYIIKNPSNGNIRGLFSLSSTSPTLPSGYTVKRLLGVFRYSSSAFLSFEQVSNGTFREFIYTSQQYVVTNGQPTINVWTDLDASAYVPTLLRGVGFVQLDFWFAGTTDPNVTELQGSYVRRKGSTGVGAIITHIKISTEPSGDCTASGYIKPDSNGFYQYMRTTSLDTYNNVSILGYRIEV